MARINAIICDFGGVLTTPLLGAFIAFQQATGIALEELGQAMASIAQRDGANPLFELETGRVSEADFLRALEQELSGQLERKVQLYGFGEQYFAHLHPNEQLIECMRELHGRGYKTAICTNNVREWEERWRAKLAVDEIFDVVVDSAFVGIRKPDPRIYEITLERLGAEAERTLFIDDTEINCEAATKLGMGAVWFRENDQALADIRQALELDEDQFSAPSRSQQ